MNQHAVIAVDAFTDAQMARIVDVLCGWATWERIPEEPPAELFVEKLARADVVVGWPEAQWLVKPSVKLLLLPSAGFDAYLGFGLGTKPGFRLCNGRGVYGIGVAEHAIALMMCLCRNLQLHVRDQTRRAFVRQPAYGEITSTTACVIGVGNIGAEIVRKCTGLGMKVIGVDRSGTAVRPLLTHLYAPDNLREAVRGADHVFCAAPGGSATRHLIDRDVFDAMPRGAYFYNVSRGSLVDERALVESLCRGHLAGAGLDVFEHEPLAQDSLLWAMENVVITPHCAGFAARWHDRLCDLVIDHLACYNSGKPLRNEVRLDTVSGTSRDASQVLEAQT